MNKTEGTLGRAKQDLLIAGTAGVLVTIVIASASAVLGSIGDAEARRLLEAIGSTSQLFCSSILTVSATILALMSTMIGLGKSPEAKLADAHYHRIVKFALYDAILFSVATIMFVLHCIPVYESDSLPHRWYPTIYYGVLITSSCLAGGAVAIVALLYLAVKDVVQVVALGMEDHCYAVSNSNDGATSDTKPIDQT